MHQPPTQTSSVPHGAGWETLCLQQCTCSQRLTTAPEVLQSRPHDVAPAADAGQAAMAVDHDEPVEPPVDLPLGASEP